MARITAENFRKIEKERNSVHDKVDATYTEFICDGQKFFQIDTYGSAYRDIKPGFSEKHDEHRLKPHKMDIPRHNYLF